MPYRYRETVGGDAQLLAAVARLFRAGGAEAAFASLTTPAMLRYDRRVSSRQRLRLRALAGRSADPRIRLDELRRRSPGVSTYSHRTMSGQQARNRMRLRAHSFAMTDAAVEQRGDVIPLRPPRSDAESTYSPTQPADPLALLADAATAARIGLTNDMIAAAEANPGGIAGLFNRAGHFTYHGPDPRLRQLASGRRPDGSPTAG
ncbi:MAG: hypothetical protein ACLP3C_15595 [Mycobacterium sp.]|uniref:hypothetical protein n=1 Tax=Mycobacterium sp. TaxID=1785 RepID=UPI003F9C0169